MSEETVTFNLELNVEQTLGQVRQLETLLYRSLSLMRRLGLPEEVSQAIYVIQRLVMSIRLLHTAMIMLESASGPIGWGLALISAATAAVSLGDVYYDGMRGF